MTEPKMKPEVKPEMKMDELYARFRDGLPPDEIVLDVRDEDEYAEGHVPGSLNIPHDRVSEKASDLKRFRKVYIHCGGGGRAGKAYAALEAAGLKNLVHICESGMRSWVAAGYPVQK